MSRHIRIADLIGMPVVEPDGRHAGHVIDLELDPRTYRVTTILLGRRGWLSRLRLLRAGGRGPTDDRIPWSRIERVGRSEIRLR